MFTLICLFQTRYICILKYTVIILYKELPFNKIFLGNIGGCIESTILLGKFFLQPKRLRKIHISL